MSVVPLYSLLVLGGNLKPNEEDLLEIYKKLGLDATNEKEKITKFLELIKEKNIFEVLQRGKFEKKKAPSIKIEKAIEETNKEENNLKTTELTNDPFTDQLLSQINIEEQFQIENAIQQNQTQNENVNENENEDENIGNLQTDEPQIQISTQEVTDDLQI
ncbi:60S ACIDIC ribosomal protein P2B [Anaeramoeba flamelloides]|uniref:60S ACIDIC ribosomal protein P2B n=1 Tax=Anaeramoeba flamelloides TaxID=1746091 RepID=A0ABQ8X6W9_9EUKA|nr:60S ACIDIC ribosomal protein P2B [Anaeramoeba flamelloides]